MIVKFCRALAVLAFLIPSLPAGKALAQAEGFTAINPDAPIQISADSFEIDTEKQIGTFEGDVEVTQDTLELKTDRLIVFYDQKQGDTKADNQSFKKLEARGNVRLSSPKEAVEGGFAVYDLVKRVVTLGGGVVITRDESVLAGDRLTMNLETGVSRITTAAEASQAGSDANNGGRQRVRALLQPSQLDKGDKSKGASDGTPGNP